LTYIINDECIMCDACLAICPTGAITAGDPRYIIKPELCTDCGDCAAVCPTDACQPQDENKSA